VADLIPTASEAEWLEARRKGITASEIAVVMGLSPWSSPYKLYHQKLGILPRDEVTAVMERGTFLEPYVVEKFTAAHPEFAVLGTGRELWSHPSRPWQMATPDRMVHELAEVDRCTCGAGPGSYAGMHEPGCGWELDRPVAVLETKTTTDMSEWGEPGTDEIPVHYRSQVLWQMDVMGVSRAHVAVLDIRQWEVSEYAVSHIDGCGPGRYLLAYPSLACPACDDVVLMREKAQEFLKQMESGDVPDVDWSAATAYTLKALHPSVTDEDVLVSTQVGKRYRAAVRNEKHWEQRKKLYEAQIREAMGSARRASILGIGREPLVRRDVYPVREHVRKATTVDKLVIVSPKKEKKHVSPDSE
jgi:putative phage-type endonuclease